MIDRAGRRWFFSYSKVLKKSGDTLICCSFVEGDEHPIARVARWNREHTDHTHVLIWFAPVDAEGLPELKIEA